MAKTRILIAAPASGSGKTTITMGLLRALRNRGIDIRPFKCGPDYIDTQWQSLAAGHPSVNLDTWMMTHGEVQQTYRHYAHAAQATLTEGAMGLFDGYERWHGSAAEVAMLTASHVVLVIDARATAFSAAAIILGANALLRRIGSKEGLAGVIFNKVGSESHRTFLSDACREADVRCFGFVPKTNDIALPSRHLGLTLDTHYQVDTLMQLLADLMERHIDIDALTDCCTTSVASSDDALPTDMPELPVLNNDDLLPALRVSPGGRIAIARDEAFNFCYERNTDLLKAAGHDIVFFSPLANDHLPRECSLVYLPGGYPEFFLDRLVASHTLKEDLRGYVESGGAVYAECGGMLYLGQYIEDEKGMHHPMAGILPLHATFRGMRLHLGYRRLTVGERCWSGHEFHYSDIVEDGHIERIGQQLNARGQEVNTALYSYKNVVAGYTHLTFGSHEKIPF